MVFDFDGVILESTDIKTDAFAEVFADHPEHAAAIREHHLSNLGISRYEKFEWIHRELLGRPLDAEERQRLGSRFEELILERVMSCPFVPGAIEALQTISDSMPAFVASGTPHSELELIVERRGLRPYFEAVWGSPHSKEEILKSVAERVGGARDELVFVGDGSSDYEAALAADVRFIARDTPPHTELWRETGVERVSDLHELPALLLEERP